MDRANILATEIYAGIKGTGCAYFVGSVATMVQLALVDGSESINLVELLKAFDNARKYTQKNGQERTG